MGAHRAHAAHFCSGALWQVDPCMVRWMSRINQIENKGLEKWILPQSVLICLNHSHQLTLDKWLNQIQRIWEYKKGNKPLAVRKRQVVKCIEQKQYKIALVMRRQPTNDNNNQQQSADYILVDLYKCWTGLTLVDNRDKEYFQRFSKKRYTSIEKVLSQWMMLSEK